MDGTANGNSGYGGAAGAPAPASAAGAPGASGTTQSYDDFATWKKVIDAAERQGEQVRTEFERFIDEYRKGALRTGQPRGGDNNRQIQVEADVNLLFMYVNVCAALLFAQAPAIEVEAQEGGGAAAFAPLVQPAGPSGPQLPMLNQQPDPQQQMLAAVLGLDGGQSKTFESADAAREAFAEAVETLLVRIGEETEQSDAGNAAVQHALLTGQAWTKLGFDPRRGVPVADTLRRDEVYVDPVARYSLRQADYVVHTVVKRYPEAEAFFLAMGVTIGEPNWTLTDGTGLQAEKVRKDGADTTKDQYKFFEIWCKHGAARKIKYIAYGKAEILTERPWPFVLTAEDFPFVPLHWNRQFYQISDAFPEGSVTEGLRRTVNEASEYFRRSTLRAFGKIVFLDEDVFDDKDVDAINSGHDLAVRRASLGGRSIEQCVHILDLNSANDPTPEKAEIFKQRNDQILGMDQLVAGANTHDMTAEEASIRANEANQRSSKKQNVVDDWQAKIAQIEAQIARQLTPPEVVSDLAGEAAALLWSLYDGDADKFAREYTVGVQAGSTGERHRLQRQQQWEHWTTLAAGANQAQPMGPTFNVHDMTLEIGRVMRIRRPERYEIQPPPPMPAPQPQIAAAPGGAIPGNPSSMSPAGMPQQIPIAGKQPLGAAPAGGGLPRRA